MSIIKRDPPYAGTTVPPETTWAQVENLLLDYGAEAVRRTRVKGGATIIEFVLTTDNGGVVNQFACQITSPTITRRRKGLIKNEWGGTQRGVVTTTDDAAAARLSLWYIKSLLEAASYGLVSAERAFTVLILPMDRWVTVALQAGAELRVPRPFKWLDPRGREQKSGRPALLFILDPEKRPCPHCHGSGRV